MLYRMCLNLLALFTQGTDCAILPGVRKEAMILSNEVKGDVKMCAVAAEWILLQ